MPPKYRRSTPPAQRVYHRSSPALVQQKFPDINVRRRTVAKITRSASTERSRHAKVDNTLTQMAFPAASKSRNVIVIEDSDFEEDMEDQRPAKRRKLETMSANIVLTPLVSKNRAGTERSENRRRSKRATRLDVGQLNLDNDKENEARDRILRLEEPAKPRLVKDNTLTQMDFFEALGPDLDLELDGLSDADSRPVTASPAVRVEIPKKSTSRRVRWSSPVQPVLSSAEQRTPKEGPRVIPDSLDIYDDQECEILSDHSQGLASIVSMVDSPDIRQQRLPMPLPIPHTPRRRRVLKVLSSQTPNATPIRFSPICSIHDSLEQQPVSPTPIRLSQKAMPPSDKHDSAQTPVCSPAVRQRPTLRSVKAKAAPGSQAVTVERSNTGSANTDAKHIDLLTQEPWQQARGPEDFDATIITQPDDNDVQFKDGITAIQIAASNVDRQDDHGSPLRPIAPAKSQVGLTQINRAFAFSHMSADHETQRSQTTRNRIREFNLAMSKADGKAVVHAAMPNQHSSLINAAAIGLETQLELLNDEVNGIADFTADDLSLHPIPLSSGNVLNSAPASITREAATVPLKEAMVVVGATAELPSPAAWKQRFFIADGTQASHAHTEEMLAHQLYSESIGYAQRIAFSQASTVPCTPTKSSVGSRRLPSTSPVFDGNVVDLVTSTPDRYEQAMSSSPIEERFIVHESQDQSPLASSAYNHNPEEDGSHFVDDLPLGTRHASSRPLGISQLLPSSIMNSSIPLPPRWQESIDL